ncbi:MAG: T9SS type A sorting domain-containing protein [Saprospiraceae bacterium]
MNNQRVIISIIFLFLSFFFHSIYAQCYPDRHNTTLDGHWLSCSESSSPNPGRNKGHWILFELDKINTIRSLQIWNVNHPDYLRSGAKKITLDYMDANGQWKTHEAFTVKKGDGSGFYEGETLQMSEDVTTDKVLLSITENHGGGCYGMAEVKLNLKPTSTPTQDIAEDHFEVTINPNPFHLFTSVTIRDLEEKTISYEVINNVGQVISLNQATTHQGIAQFDINVSDMPSGQYYLKITDGLRVSSRKLSHLTH